ncbi:MAG: phosphate/phosphite/phosphonate ABC transporter substrate-binding protein [Pseudomonadota bacterium]
MRFLTTTAVLVAMTATAAFADDSWKADYPVVRMGVLSGENEADRLKRYEPFRQYMADKLGVEVEIFTAGSYDGVVQAMAGDQIEFARFGSSSYAAAYTATDGKVVPLLTTITEAGNTGYISVIMTRCDSGLDTLDDLEGLVLAFADPDSTSGYAVPYFNLVDQGYEPTEFFENVPFSGSHEAGVLGVVEGTYDAAATWADRPGWGNWSRMEAKGMIEPGTVCVIWESPEITSGPLTTRNNLPQALVDDFVAAHKAFPTEMPQAFMELQGMDGTEEDPDVGYVEVNHERYQWIIDMRAWLREQRRG